MKVKDKEKVGISVWIITIVRN